MNWQMWVPLGILLVFAAGCIMARWWLRKAKVGKEWNEHTDPTLPKFSAGEQVLYHAAQYPELITCEDPFCASPEFTEGQVIERFQAGNKFLGVCLDCIERNQKLFVGEME